MSSILFLQYLKLILKFLYILFVDTNKDTTKVRTKSGGAETLTRLRSNSFSENSPERAKMRHSTG